VSDGTTRTPAVAAGAAASADRRRTMSFRNVPGAIVGAIPGGRPGRVVCPDRAAMVRLSAERRWSGVGDFKYGQWRYQLVETCPRDLDWGIV
jgi:hypothetical protein